MQNDLDQTNCLAEIFLTPSEQTISDRFEASTDAAKCSGKCENGMCTPGS